jgi:hypothetical protein
MHRLFRPLAKQRPPFAAALAVLLVLLAPFVPAPHARADVPPCRYKVGGDTVLDNLTGLTWQRRDNGDRVFWNDAVAACYRLDLDGGGWRLPSIRELQTLIDIREVVAIDETVFSSTRTYFWSSTPYAADPDTMWMIDYTSGGPIDFLGAHLDTMGKSEESLGVRCVR